MSLRVLERRRHVERTVHRACDAGCLPGTRRWKATRHHRGGIRGGPVAIGRASRGCQLDDVPPSPRCNDTGSQIDATAITGMVSPMLAIAEPNARLRLV